MDRKLFKSILLIITYAALLVLILTRLEAVGTILHMLLDLVRPLLLGFAIAFVLNRPCRFFCRLYTRIFGQGKGRSAAKPLAVLSSYIVLFAAIAALFAFVVPRLIDSTQLFALRLEDYILNLQDSANELMAYLKLEQVDLSSLKATLNKLFSKALEVLSTMGPHLLALAGSIISLAVTVLLALVFSIYMLYGSETLLRQSRHLLQAYLPSRVSEEILRVVHITSDTFTNFISGQLIEACILGGLCAAGMIFIQADYAPLIGVIIGVGALIPIAGAYIAAFLSALLLLMVSPVKALTFLVFLVVLQQIEGNVIYPRVVGTSIGLPGIWVLAAITVGGGLFGLAGIILSVPLASVIYTLLRQDVHRRLKSSEN